MKWLFVFLLLLLALTASAQKDSVQRVYGIKAYGGQVFVHTDAVRNIKGAKPFGLELEIAKQQTGFASWNLSSAYLKTGWALSYFDYNNSIAGHGIIASRFIEPQYRVSNKLQFLLKASIGAAYLSNPYDVVKNPTNNNYSLHLNPYLHIGGGFNYHLSKHSTIALLGNFHHISNGNLRQPNKGINWVTGALSYNYYLDNNTLPRYNRVYNNFWKNKQTELAFGVLGVAHQGYNSKWKAERMLAFGFFAQVTKQVGRTSALTGGTEIIFNHFRIDETAPQPSSSTVIGIHGGHVFLLGRIRFSQQLGYAVYNQLSFLGNFYHRWGIDYQLNSHYSLGVNLKVNSDNADFFDLRFTYKL